MNILKVVWLSLLFTVLSGPAQAQSDSFPASFDKLKDRSKESIRLILILSGVVSLEGKEVTQWPGAYLALKAAYMHNIKIKVQPEPAKGGQFVLHIPI